MHLNLIETNGWACACPMLCLAHCSPLHYACCSPLHYACCSPLHYDAYLCTIHAVHRYSMHATHHCTMHSAHLCTMLLIFALYMLLIVTLCMLLTVALCMLLTFALCILLPIALCTLLTVTLCTLITGNVTRQTHGSCFGKVLFYVSFYTVWKYVFCTGKESRKGCRHISVAFVSNFQQSWPDCWRLGAPPMLWHDTYVNSVPISKTKIPQRSSMSLCSYFESISLLQQCSC